MPKQILIADDDPVLLNLYTRMLAGMGCAVSLASSFAEAAVLINSHSYDLLVTDLVFPDGVGTDLITIFERKQGRAKCILVTGSATELDPDKTPVLAGYFEKPLDADAFIAAVTKALA
ncbi:MAG: response regulator [Elusimicrobiota bacterium]|nr:response regulator [Elusimicrobiota bacterium]